MRRGRRQSCIVWERCTFGEVSCMQVIPFLCVFIFDGAFLGTMSKNSCPAFLYYMTEGWRLLRWGLGVVPAITYHCNAVPVVQWKNVGLLFRGSTVRITAMSDIIFIYSEVSHCTCSQVLLSTWLWSAMILSNFTITFVKASAHLALASACFGTFGSTFSTFGTTLLGEGSLMSVHYSKWSILLIESDLKWRKHLSRNLFLYSIQSISKFDQIDSYKVYAISTDIDPAFWEDLTVI